MWKSDTIRNFLKTNWAKDHNYLLQGAAGSTGEALTVPMCFRGKPYMYFI